MGNLKLFIRVIFTILLLTFSSILTAQDNWIAAKEDCYSEIDMRDGTGADLPHNDWQLRIRSDDDSFRRDAYLKFALESTNYSFPEDVKLAFLKLTINRWYNQRSDYYASFSLYGVDDNTWTEDALSWNNAPWSKANTGPIIATFSEMVEQIAASDPVKPLYFNITNYVKNQLSQGNVTISIVMSDTTYGETWYNGTDIRLFSKDCIDPVIGAAAEKNPDSTFLPYLVINENPMWVGYDQIVASEDCYLEKSADTGAGGTTTFNTWRVWIRSDDDKQGRVTYLKFSLDNTGYTFAEDVDSVFLSLTIDRLYNYGGNYSTFAVYDIGDNSWSETTLTWDTAPWLKENAGAAIATFTEQLEQIAGTDPIYPIWFDITDYVRDQLNQGNTIFSLALCDTSYWETWAKLSDIRIFSKDCLDPVLGVDAEKDPDPSYFPSLYIKDTGGPVAVNTQRQTSPAEFILHHNYPNPFNPETQISFEIPKTDNVNLVVYNVLGEKVKDLVSGRKEAGHHRVSWDGTSNSGEPMPTGVYFSKLTVDNQSQIIKMLLVR